MAKAKKPTAKKKPAARKKPAKKSPAKKSAKKPAAKKVAPKKRKAAVLKLVPLGELPTIELARLPEQAFEVVYQPSKLKLRPLAEPARVLEGHTAFVQALAFSPDGNYLVTGSEDATIRVWSLADGTCVRTGTDHSSAVNFVAFSTDGELLSASDDHTVKRWTFPALACVQTLTGHADYVSKVRAAGPGRCVSSSKDGTVRLWDFATGKQLRSFGVENGGWMLALGASNDGHRAVSCNDRNKMTMWNLDTGAEERVLYDASAGYIGEVMGMTLAAQNLSGLGHANYPKVIAFAPDDRTCLSAEKDLIEWDLATGEQLRRIEGDGWAFGGVAMIPDRAVVLRESADEDERNFIAQLERTQRDREGNREIRTVYGDWLEDRGRLAEANSVREHGAFRYVFSCSRGAVHVLDLAMGTIVAQAAWLHDDLHNVAVSSDGRVAACGSADGPVALWDVDALLRAGLPDRHLSRPTELAVSTEGIALSITSDRTARLWSRDGTTSVRLPPVDGMFAKARIPRADLALVLSDHGVVTAYAPTGEPRGVARFSAEGEGSHSFGESVLLSDGRLLSSGFSKELAIWPLDPVAPPSKFAAEAGHVTALAVDEPSDTVVTAKYASGEEPMQLQLWSLSRRAPIRELTWKLDKVQYVTSISFVDDLLALTTSEGGLVICDREGTVKQSLRAKPDYILDAMTLPDGTLVVNTGRPMFFDVRTGKPLGQLAEDDLQYELLHGTTLALRYNDEGVELVELADRTVTTTTPVSIRNVTGSPRAEFVIGAALDDAVAGVPIVLRRI
jgi:WD40 repeat protein